jgi:hypothetical protein
LLAGIIQINFYGKIMKWRNNFKRKSRYFLAARKGGVAGSQSLKFFRPIILPKNSLALHQEDFSLRDLGVLCS